MKINVGDYVRTKDGYICKIININDFREPALKYGVEASYLKDIMFIDDEDIIKSSSNIIDLIKKKDILVDYTDNIYKVVKVWKGYVFTDKKNEYGQTITLVDYQIKSIITSEIFESMQYKVG